VSGPDRWVRTPQDAAELLSVDSGEIAIVNLAHAAALAHEVASHAPSPYEPIQLIRVVADGVVCQVGGDGQFAFQIHGSGAACTGIDIWLDDTEGLPQLWEPAAIITVDSGTLLVADPHLINEYTVEEFEGPVFLGGLWMELRLPAAGDLALEIGIRENIDADAPPAALRARWLGALPREER
jgi:hypothetical protein